MSAFFFGAYRGVNRVCGVTGSPSKSGTASGFRAFLDHDQDFKKKL